MTSLHAPMEALVIVNLLGPEKQQDTKWLTRALLRGSQGLSDSCNPPICPLDIKRVCACVCVRACVCESVRVSLSVRL